MGTVQTTFTLPAETAEQLADGARRMGMSVEAFIGYLANTVTRKHDAQFGAAVRNLYTKYPETLRKLSQ